MKTVIKNSLKSICYVALFVGMQYIVSFVVMFAYGIIVGVQAGMSGTTPDVNALNTQLMNDVLQMTSWLTFASGALTILFLLVFFAIRKKNLWREAGVTSLEKEKVLPLIIFGIAMSFFVTFVLSILPIPEEIMESYNASSQSLFMGSLLSRILAIVIMAPVLEEIIFRGLVLSRMKRAMNTGIAILLSSLLFGLMHGHILWVAYATISGIVMAVIAEKSKSIGASILVHMAFNSVSIWGAGIEPEGAMLYVIGLTALAVMAGCCTFIFRKKQQGASTVDAVENAC